MRRIHTEKEQFIMEKTAQLAFHSFDGGGPEFTVKISDPRILSCSMRRDYGSNAGKDLCGAGYTVFCTFTGLEAGETAVTIEERSPIADNLDHFYTAAVSEDLAVTITKNGCECVRQ